MGEVVDLAKRRAQSRSRGRFEKLGIATAAALPASLLGIAGFALWSVVDEPSHVYFSIDCPDGMEAVANMDSPKVVKVTCEDGLESTVPDSLFRVSGLDAPALEDGSDAVLNITVAGSYSRWEVSDALGYSSIGFIAGEAAGIELQPVGQE